MILHDTRLDTPISPTSPPVWVSVAVWSGNIIETIPTIPIQEPLHIYISTKDSGDHEKVNIS